MTGNEGSATFGVPADAYDLFMGRYSRRLAEAFAEAVLPSADSTRFLDVGCGPGALTGVAAACYSADHVAAVDPTPGFVASCQERHPDVDVRVGPAEELPFGDAEFDCVAAQLAFHFVSDPPRAMAEMMRVARPHGLIAASVWDFAEGMQMLRAFWDAAVSLDPEAPDEARTMRFGGVGELTDLFTTAGLLGVTESTLTVSTTYEDFDELWRGFLTGVGPAGAYVTGRPPAARDALRDAIRERLGNPQGPFELRAVARVATGRVPTPR